MTQYNPFIPVILSGGTGSRLWPISRESHPKPFIKLPDGYTLLQKTFLRAIHLPDVHDIITLTNKEYYLKTKADYEKYLTANHHITLSYLLEPYARNTAPAICLAALKVLAMYGPDAIMLVLPADHLIENLEVFIADCKRAFAIAKENAIVTFGVKPTYPETGYGYIEYHREQASHPGCYRVKRFVEKPGLQLAKKYSQSEKYLWNTGMFCFKAGVFLQELKKHANALLACGKACLAQTEKTNKSKQIYLLDKESYAGFDHISIDYALMEKSTEIAVITSRFDWQDIGSWEAYKKLYAADQNGNTILGNAILIDSQDNLIHSEGRMVASIGINNLAVIDTPDALLITHRNLSQEVKQVVAHLKKTAHESYLHPRTVIRPWGSYTVLEEGPAYKIKRIVVKPRASLSLQLHEHRSEHWVVVEGEANVTNGGEIYQLHVNESTFVPMKTPHRLSNTTDKNLIIIEVQTGAYLGEDDIKRLDDTYGREVV